MLKSALSHESKWSSKLKMKTERAKHGVRTVLRARQRGRPCSWVYHARIIHIQYIHADLENEGKGKKPRAVLCAGT
jgi:hypothetical protein